MNAPQKAQKKRGPKRSRDPVSPAAAKVGKTLERLRADQQLKSLAEQLGTTHQALSLIETGQLDPNSPKANSKLVALAVYFQHDLGLQRLRRFVNLSDKERDAVIHLAVESGRSFHDQIYVLVIEALREREMIDAA